MDVPRSGEENEPILGPVVSAKKCELIAIQTWIPQKLIEEMLEKFDGPNAGKRHGDIMTVTKSPGTGKSFINSFLVNGIGDGVADQLL